MRAVYLIPALFFSLLAAGLAACADSDLPTTTRPGSTSVFVCEIPGESSFEFTVRFGPGELAAWLPRQFERPYLVLALRDDDGSAEYAEGDVSIRLRGDVADLGVGQSLYENCRRDAERSAWEHAKLTGVDFRATGDDPDWVLEIRNKREISWIVTADGIDVRATAAAVEQRGDMGIYRAPTGSGMLEIQVGGAACPAGGLDGSAVAVFLEGVMYPGCGRALH